MSSTSSPCAACKLQRRKCTQECIFAPYFPPEEPQKFACIHKVFGASNVSKLLNELNAAHRKDAVDSLAYEAEARLRDPVYGCVGCITILKQKLQQVQNDLDIAKKELATYIGPAAMLPMLQHPGNLVVSYNAPPMHHQQQQQQQQIFAAAQQYASSAVVREQETVRNYEQQQQQQQQQEMLRFGGGFDPTNEVSGNGINQIATTTSAADAGACMSPSLALASTSFDNPFQIQYQQDQSNHHHHHLQVQLLLQQQQGAASEEVRSIGPSIQ